MIQELENNAVFSTEYRNTAPAEGDLAAIFENGGRKLLMRLREDGSMELPEAVLFRQYWLDPDDGDALQKAAENGGRLVYLFTVSGTSYYSFIYDGGDTPDFSFTGMEFLPFSFENRPLPKNVFFGAETSWQLSSWYNDNRRCGRCGAPMYVHPKIRCVRCTSCGYMVFPRVLPAVIIAVIHNDRLLMIRYRGREEDGYAGTALIAGFVETGETVEQAVRREIMEETGIAVKNIRYLSSQPWPFPNSLMLAFEAEWESGEAKPDGTELVEIGWFTRETLPTIPAPGSIAHKVITQFFNL